MATGAIWRRRTHELMAVRVARKPARCRLSVGAEHHPRGGRKTGMIARLGAVPLCMPVENEKARKAASGPMPLEQLTTNIAYEPLLRQAGGVELFQAALRHLGYLRSAGRLSYRARGGLSHDHDLRQTRGAELPQTAFQYLGFDFSDSCRLHFDGSRRLARGKIGHSHEDGLRCHPARRIGEKSRGKKHQGTRQNNRCTHDRISYMLLVHQNCRLIALRFARVVPLDSIQCMNRANNEKL